MDASHIDEVEGEKLEWYGNKGSFNMELILKEQITSHSLYYQSLQNLTFSRVVDEIYKAVEHVEPWMPGNVRGASTAFCLLHRLAEIGLNTEQLKYMLNSDDSPYIRAIGFLYLRYGCNPRNIWEWIQEFVDDEEEFSPSPYADPITMGAFVRDIFLDMYYFETILPRIPQHILNTFKLALKEKGLPSEPKVIGSTGEMTDGGLAFSVQGNAGTGGPSRREDNAAAGRPMSVKSSLSVKLGGISAKVQRRRVGEGKGPAPRAPPVEERAERGQKGERARERSRSKERGGRAERDSADRGGDRDRDRDRALGRDRDRDRALGRDKDGDRDRALGRDRDRRGRGRDRERERDRDRDRGRGGRSAADVFGGGAHSKFKEAPVVGLGNRTLSNVYGDTSGSLSLGGSGGANVTRGVEAYRIGRSAYKY